MKKILLLGILIISIFQTMEARGFKNTTTLTPIQIQNMLFMYEEEKMARDVYITLGNIWKQRIFTNIAKSEQNHMNAVGRLLIQQKVRPKTASIGRFYNAEIQNLYNTLIAKGKISLTSALLVGKSIEEKDIADLKAQIPTMPIQVQRVYNNLLRASYSHLNAFTKSL